MRAQTAGILGIVAALAVCAIALSRRRPAGDELPALYARAAYFVLPGEEDFGIAPVEAQAAGRPVLALGQGGALETVLPGETGVFFSDASEDSLTDALPQIERLAREADPACIRQNALRFGVDRFGPEITAAVAVVSGRYPSPTQ